MPSKLVLNHQKSSRSVSAAIKTHGPAIAEKIEQRLAGVLEAGEKMPDVGLLFVLLDRVSQSELKALTAFDEHLEFERIDDANARSGRVLAARDLSKFVSDLAAGVTYIFGDKTREPLLLTGSTPTDPTKLVEQAARIATALTKTVLPAPRPGMTFDAHAEAQTLRDLTARLTAAIKLADEEPRQTERALLTRDDAARTYNIGFTRITSIFELMCEFADEPELASRVRRTASKPGRTLEDRDPTEDPTPSSNPSPAPASDSPPDSTPPKA